MKLLQVLPPETSAKLVKIQTALALDEQADAMRILKSYPADDLQDLLTTFDLASLEQCVDFLRRLIGEWRRTRASRSTRAADPPPPGDVCDGDVIGNAADPRATYAASVVALRAAQAEQELTAQEHAAQLASAVAAASSPGPGINVFKLLRLLPPYTATKLVHINAALSPEEQADAMQVLKSYSVEGMHELLAAFDTNPVDECTTFLRRVIADWRAHQAAEMERAKKVRSGVSGSGGAIAATDARKAAGSDGTISAAGPSNAPGSSIPGSAAAPSVADGTTGPTVATGSIGVTGAVGSSSARSAAAPSGATGPSGPSRAAGSGDTADSSDAVSVSSAAGPRTAITPSSASGPAGRSGSGSKKTR